MGPESEGTAWIVLFAMMVACVDGRTNGMAKIDPTAIEFIRHPSNKRDPGAERRETA